MRIELGAVAVARAFLAVDADVGLRDARHARHHVRRGPRRAARTSVRVGAGDGAVGGDAIERLGLAADDAAFLHVADKPAVEVAEVDVFEFAGVGLFVLQKFRRVG